MLGRWVRDADSILEIGSRYGENLRFLAAFMRGNRIVSVDLPNVEGWNDGNVLADLIGVINHLNDSWFDATLVVGDSNTDEAYNEVKKHAPFDVVFIDGDHSYGGVKADWSRYGSMGRQVIFHDINPDNGLGVSRLWAELKGEKEEFIAPGSQMGIGRILEARN